MFVRTSTLVNVSGRCSAGRKYSASGGVFRLLAADIRDDADDLRRRCAIPVTSVRPIGSSPGKSRARTSR